MVAILETVTVWWQVLQFATNVPTLVDGGVCGLVDSATSYKRVLVAGRILNIN